jgi:hypothetical protein
MGETNMENTNTSHDTNNTINNITNIVDTLNPSWIQKMVLDICLNDLQEIHYKKELLNDR